MVISNIELLLGEAQIKQLSPTDTWLLLLGAYLHDIGMALMWEKVEAEWQTDHFKNYLRQLRSSPDQDLRTAANYILGAEHTSTEQQVSWPLQVSRYTTLIVADYYRSKHGAISGKYIQELGKEWGLDLSFNGLIQPRLISLLGEVAQLHTRSSKEVIRLPYKSIGHNADYIHPRFAAEMIRMGDLLDVDNNRFNPILYKAIGGIPESSQIHIEKHLSTKHILITPDRIEYKADCQTIDVYRAVRSFVTGLIEETDFLTKEWRSIVPENFLGSAPRLEKTEILLNGEPDLNEVADLRFNITQERAFQMIEGSNLYGDKYLCIGELLQNAMDACRLQLWRDLNSGCYDAWLCGAYQEQGKSQNRSYQNLSPFDIDKKIYENYPVYIRSEAVQQDGMDLIKITVSDNGTGITVDTLKQMCSVGMNYQEKQELSIEIDEMPVWLKPTGGFGIGLQSVFLLVDQFEIVSRSEQGEITALLESRKKNGYVRITASNKRKKRGTDIILYIPRTQIEGLEYYNYDPFGENSEVQEEKIFNLLLLRCVESLFPIEVSINGREVAKLSVKDFGWGDWGWIEEDGYLYSLKKDLTSIKVWDQKKMFYVEMDLDREGWGIELIRRYGFFFKGTYTCSEWNGWYIPDDEKKYSDFKCRLDIYGMQAREALALNRTLLSSDIFKRLSQNCIEVAEFYVKALKTAYQNGNPIFEQNELPGRVLFRFLNPEEKRAYLAKFPLLNRRLPLHEIDWEQHKLIPKTLEICEILDQVRKPGRVACLCWDFRYHSLAVPIDFWVNLQKAIDAEQISKDCRYIIHSTVEYDFLESYGVEGMEIINHADLYYLCEDEGKKAYLKEQDLEFFYSVMLTPIRSWKFEDRHRKCVPVLEKYKDLVVEEMPDNAFSLYSHMYSIVSPFLSRDISDANTVDRDSYIANIMGRKDFKKLLAYVYENRKNKKCTKEDIQKAYRQLILESYDRLQDREHPIKKF